MRLSLGFFLVGLSLASALLGVAHAESVNGALPEFQLERYYSVPQSAKVDPPVRVGDILRFRWIGEPKPSSAAVSVNTAEGDKPLAEQGWEVFAQPKDDPTSAFSMIPLKSGSIVLPSLVVQDADGRSLGKTRSIPFQVESSASGEETRRKAPDFLPPIAMNLPWPMVILLVGGALLGAIVFAILGWKIYQKRKLGKSVNAGRSPEVILSEDEQALVLLQKLESLRHATEGRYKPHYFGISEILKHYVERRFGFEAAECTTRELLERLVQQKVDGALVDQIADLFQKLDRVKFTDFAPDTSECSTVLQAATEWVRLTRRKAGHSGGSGAA